MPDSLFILQGVCDEISIALHFIIFAPGFVVLW